MKQSQTQSDRGYTIPSISYHILYHDKLKGWFVTLQAYGGGGLRISDVDPPDSMPGSSQGLKWLLK